MKLKNYVMDNLMTDLEPMLNHKGMLGYAASRNYRKLRDATMEYTQVRERIFAEHGKPELDADGNPTSRMVISLTDPDAQEAIQELRRYAEIEHDVELMKLPIRDIMDDLTGKELLTIELMLEDEGENDDDKR